MRAKRLLSKQLRQIFSVAVIRLVVLGLLLLIPAAVDAKVGYTLTINDDSSAVADVCARQSESGICMANDDADVVTIHAWDQNREKNALVLYTSDYGPTTRTNAYGVELVLAPLGQDRYRVQPATHRKDCMLGKGLAVCGNTPIVGDNVVLSAHGKSKRILSELPEGAVVTLATKWFTHASKKISVINPHYGNNARYCSFPGCRGSGQLVIYTPGIGRPKTNTNEFGFEASVVNGRVVAHEGSDSSIPPDGFVISGHGSSRNWLIAHAPIGAAVQLSGDGQVITITVDAESYRQQLEHRLTYANQRRLCGTWYLPRREDENPCLQIEAGIERANTLLAEPDQQIAAAEAFYGLTEQLNRAIWASHMPFKQRAIKGIWHRPVEQSRQEVARTLDFLKGSGLNTVFLETYFHGYTIFPSKTMAAYGLPTKNPTQSMDNPLAVWVDEAHQRGMQIHTWMEVFYGGNKVAPPTTDDPMGPILAKYPTWGNQNYGGRFTAAPDVSTLETGAYFLDPANPEVTGFLLKLFEEVAVDYEIDGLQLDYIRYPSSLPKTRYTYLESSWGYTPAARQAFQAIGGVDPNSFSRQNIGGVYAGAWRAWQVFKAQQVTNFVQAVNANLDEKVTRPNFKISAAVFPREGDAYTKKHQDWPTWVANGWVDMLNPMTLTSALKMIASDTNRVVRLRDELNPALIVNSGLFGPFNGNKADMVLQQIDIARENRADGFALFDTAHLTGRVGKAIKTSQR